MTIDWRNEEAIRELTVASILYEFQGKIMSYQMPKGYLCPRIPQRKAYIDWITKLMREVESKKEGIKGFDV